MMLLRVLPGADSLSLHNEKMFLHNLHEMSHLSQHLVEDPILLPVVDVPDASVALEQKYDIPIPSRSALPKFSRAKLS